MIFLHRIKDLGNQKEKEEERIKDLKVRNQTLTFLNVVFGFRKNPKLV